MITRGEAAAFGGSVAVILGWRWGLITDGTAVTAAIGGVIGSVVYVGAKLVTAWLASRGIEYVEK